MPLKKALLLTALAVAPAAQSAVIIDIVESGANVVATATGSINTAGLTFFSAASTSVGVRPATPRIRAGTGSATDLYNVAFTSSSAIGSGSSFTAASSGTGSVFGISSSTTLNLPSGYVSGAAINSTATWNSTTFAGLGLTEGSYDFTWGAGGNADSITVNVGAVPEPSAYAAIAGVSLMGFAAWRRRRVVAQS